MNYLKRAIKLLLAVSMVVAMLPIVPAYAVTESTNLSIESSATSKTVTLSWHIPDATEYMGEYSINSHQYSINATTDESLSIEAACGSVVELAISANVSGSWTSAIETSATLEGHSGATAKNAFRCTRCYEIDEDAMRARFESAACAVIAGMPSAAAGCLPLMSIIDIVFDSDLTTCGADVQLMDKTVQIAVQWARTRAKIFFYETLEQRNQIDNWAINNIVPWANTNNSYFQGSDGYWYSIPVHFDPGEGHQCVYEEYYCSTHDCEWGCNSCNNHCTICCTYHWTEDGECHTTAGYSPCC